MRSPRLPNLTVTLTWAEFDALYGIAVRAEEDGRWLDGHERRALGRALDKVALARAAVLNPEGVTRG